MQVETKTLLLFLTSHRSQTIESRKSKRGATTSRTKYPRYDQSAVPRSSNTRAYGYISQLRTPKQSMLREPQEGPAV